MCEALLFCGGNRAFHMIFVHLPMKGDQRSSQNQPSAYRKKTKNIKKQKIF